MASLLRRVPVGLPDSKVHGVNMRPIWGRQDPGGPHVGPMNFAIWAVATNTKYTNGRHRVCTHICFVWWIHSCHTLMIYFGPFQYGSSYAAWGWKIEKISRRTLVIKTASFQCATSYAAQDRMKQEKTVHTDHVDGFTWVCTLVCLRR